MHNLTTKDMIWMLALAFVGVTVTAYIVEDVIFGGALGWTVGGAFLGTTYYPVFKTLMERQRLR